MAKRDVIVIGGSAGAIPVMTQLVRGLPVEFPAAILLVIHTSPHAPGILPGILERAGELSSSAACDGQQILPGHIYIAPPDHHLLVRNKKLRLSRGPRENGFRPAIDPLFRTAARELGPRVIGLILSGGMDDGTEGLIEIKRHGGITIAQDPEEAMFSSMPSSAIAKAGVDYVLPAAEMPAMLTQLTSQSGDGRGSASPNGRGSSEKGLDTAEKGTGALRQNLGPPSGFTCPECGGAVWELQDGELVRYRCHVGHSYTADALQAAQNETVEAAFWAAMRALEEHAALNESMAERFRTKWPLLTERYEARARDARARSDIIRSVLVRGSAPLNHGEEPAPVKKPDRPARTKRARKGASTAKTGE